MTTHCFYHKVDWDGVASAAIVQHCIPDVILHPFNYDCEFPLDQIDRNDVVYFVDVSLQPYTKIFEVCAKAKRVIIIDHHKTLIDAANSSAKPDNLELVLDPTFAGCELVWNYFNPKEETPRAICLLGQYDSWRDKEEKKKPYDREWEIALSFQFGMRNYELDVTFFRENVLFDSTLVPEIIERGELILKYQDNQNKIAMKSSFLFEIEGFKCLCLNTGFRNSQVFSSVWNEKEYDMMLAFSYTGSRWSYSAYSTKQNIDCGAFAKMFGGGGHRGAAGFYTDELIFLKKT